MTEQKKLLEDLLGTKNVCCTLETLVQYAGDKSFAKKIYPNFVVKINGAEELGNLIRWANNTMTPLVPVSSQGPHYKGDTAPGVPESIIVDLSEMKNVLGINPTYRIAVIEPGLTYTELLPFLAEKGLTLSMPLAPKKGKSVIGSILETEPRLNALHQWCNLDPLRCVEVTWGDGNRMFTGEAGGSVMDLHQQWAAEKWQWEPAGPMMLDFYRLLTGAQGTMGVVTWASVRCEILPQIHKGFLIPGKKLEDLIDFSYHVLRLRFGDEFFIMNNAQLASLIAVDRAEIESLKEMLPSWTAFVGIAGRDLLPEEKVSYLELDIGDLARQHGLQMLPAVRGVSGDTVLEKAIHPSGDIYWKESYKGAFEDIFFSTTLDQAPAFINQMNLMAMESRYPIPDIGIYLQPENMGTSWHCNFTLPYNAELKAETNNVKTFFEKASEVFFRMGAYYFRPYGIWSRLQLNKDSESYKVLQKLKNIFDPKGILNPGKLCNY
jgi:FAD/FMN-containing dehydrogenase